MKVHNTFTLGNRCEQDGGQWTFSQVHDGPGWLRDQGVFALKSYGFLEGVQATSTLSIIADPSRKRDSYQLDVTASGDVLIIAESHRALRYALETLSQSIRLNERTITLPIMRVKDGPDMAVRGFIEGFYGTPWSHETRLTMIDSLAAWRYNAYFYAPKDDRYHRDLWRMPYPDDKLAELLELKSACDAQAVDFHFAISPGKDFNPCLEEDYNALYRKIDQVLAHGVRHIALLFDDIEPVLDAEATARFKRLGIVHAHVTNQLHDYLNGHLSESVLTVCPTEYSHVGPSVYREDFGRTLHAGIPVFFTGHNVVAEVLDVDDVIATEAAYGRALAIWDNFPVNDFLKSRLFLGPLRNRDSRLADHVDIMVMNPMNQAYASLVSLATAAMYMWHSGAYHEDDAYAFAVSKLVPKPFQEAYRVFASWHQESALETDDVLMTPDDIQALESAVKTLLAWTSPWLEEVRPWLELAQEMCVVLTRYDRGENVDEAVRRYVEQPYAFGNQSIDVWLEAHGLLKAGDRDQLARKARGNGWWRVFESKLKGGS